VLHRLTDLGNTIIIIEHNLDVIRNADWILDLGPEGGEDGGRVVGEGRPAKIAATPGSYTGEFLKRYYTSANGHLEAIDLDDESAAVDAPASAEGLESEMKESAASVNGSGAKSNGKVSRKGTVQKKTAKKKCAPRRKKTVLP